MGCGVGHSRDMFGGIALYALEEVISNIKNQISKLSTGHRLVHRIPWI
jgi:TfoX/Sxy family transcriptional regulator of competence genes